MQIINLFKTLLVIPNIPIIFFLTLWYRDEEDNLEERIVDTYPEWLFYLIGISGYAWLIYQIIY